jgi:nucleotide-binding universal stress UspA family protein
MGTIVCATRGGAGSRSVQEKAISYANENGHELVFLFVIDTSSVDIADEFLIPAIQAELRWVGRTLLRIAQKRAENADVTSEIVIRKGLVEEEICSFLKERSADLLFLGAPRGTTASNIGDDVIEQVAQSIQDGSGVPVEIVRPEEV